MTWTPITLEEVAEVVAAACSFELGLRYGRSEGAAALVDALERDNRDLDAALDVLSWQVAANLENLFGPSHGHKGERARDGQARE